MKKDLLKIVYNDRTILTIDDERIKTMFVDNIMKFHFTSDDVTLMNGDTKEQREAKKFVLTQTEGIKIPALGLFLMFPEGSTIYIYKN